LTNPASIPTENVFACRFDPSGNYLAIGFASPDAASNYFWVYKRSGDTFTKLADPAIQTTDACNDLAWTADGTRLIVSTDNDNTFMYRRSGDIVIYEHSFGDSVGCAVYPKSKSQR
jgi:WD40 repeat protein